MISEGNSELTEVTPVTNFTLLFSAKLDATKKGKSFMVFLLSEKSTVIFLYRLRLKNFIGENDGFWYLYNSQIFKLTFSLASYSGY